MDQRPNIGSSNASLSRRVVVIASIVLALMIGVFVVWQASNAVLTVLAAIVVAVLFDGGAQGLMAISPLGRNSALTAVFLLLALALGLGSWWGGNALIDQLQSYLNAVAGQIDMLRAFLMEHGLGSSKPSSLLGLLPTTTSVIGGASEVAALVFDVVATTILIIILAGFFAWQPQVYKPAILSLIPIDKRARVDEVLNRSVMAMRQWMLGQAVTMVVTFAFTLCALLIIGMPYAVMLAIVTGLLTFIPTVGAFFAGVAIVLAGCTQSPTMALYGFAVYILAQAIESNLVTPLVQEKTLQFPPGATLTAQLVMGSLFGLLGLAFAIPIVAAGTVIVEELYVKDQLGGAWPGEPR